MHHTIRKLLNEFIGEYPILFFASIILIVVVIGTFAFHITEGWNFFDSFYFTTVTMATVGYGDMAPLTHGGKIFSIVYGFMGAPLFIGFTGLFFQSKFQKLIKHSLHAYHREAKEAEEIATELLKENHQQEKEIKKIQKEIN